MTNINCLANCIYQKDGKCSFENVYAKPLTFGADCAYYSPLKKRDNGTEILHSI